MAFHTRHSSLFPSLKCPQFAQLPQPQQLHPRHPCHQYSIHCFDQLKSQNPPPPPLPLPPGNSHRPIKASRHTTTPRRATILPRATECSYDPVSGAIVDILLSLLVKLDCLLRGLGMDLVTYDPIIPVIICITAVSTRCAGAGGAGWSGEGKGRRGGAVPGQGRSGLDWEEESEEDVDEG